MKKLVLLLSVVLIAPVLAQNPPLGGFTNYPIQRNIQITRPIGAIHTVTGQVTASGTAATLVAARLTRREVMISNTDAAITVYVGPPTVTSGNGYVLKAGQNMTLRSNDLIQVLAASGSPVVTYAETYD